jgi:hypothetical protein
VTGVLLITGLIAASSPVSVAVTGACPSGEAVTAALRSALGADTPSAGADVPKVSDLGDRFSVAASGQVREYADPRRDCDERARAAAVFIALALNPPLVAPAAPPPTPQVIASPPPPAPPESTGWLDLGVAARLDGGPAPALGAEVRASAGRRWFGLTATAGVLAPTETTFSSVVVRQQRFPLSLSLAARRGLTQRLALAGAVGAALVPLTLRADALDGPSETRLDAGVHLAGELAFAASPRLRPFVALHAEIFPRAYQLEVDPLGNVGSTGRFWAGVSVGLSFAALR